MTDEKHICNEKTKLIAISFAALSVLSNIIPNAAFQMKSLKILCLRS